VLYVQTIGNVVEPHPSIGSDNRLWNRCPASIGGLLRVNSNTLFLKTQTVRENGGVNTVNGLPRIGIEIDDNVVKKYSYTG
jgi:hypothetical protein